MLLNWIVSQRKKVMSPVELWLLVPGGAGWGVNSTRACLASPGMMSWSSMQAITITSNYRQNGNKRVLISYDVKIRNITFKSSHIVLFQYILLTVALAETYGVDLMLVRRRNV